MLRNRMQEMIFISFGNYLQSTKSPTLAKLKANDFIYFLKILDFSDCGTGSRFVQKQKTIEAIVQFAGFSGSQFAELNVFVRDKMMPGNRTNNLITEKDVLNIFGFGWQPCCQPPPTGTPSA